MLQPLGLFGREPIADADYNLLDTLDASNADCKIRTQKPAISQCSALKTISNRTRSLFAERTAGFTPGVAEAVRSNYRVMEGVRAASR
jgi:hypothetical protein